MNCPVCSTQLELTCTLSLRLKCTCTARCSKCEFEIGDICYGVSNRERLACQNLQNSQ